MNAIRIYARYGTYKIQRDKCSTYGPHLALSGCLYMNFITEFRLVLNVLVLIRCKV